MTTIPVTTQDRIPIPVSLPARPAQAAGTITPSDVIRIVKQRIYLIIFFVALFAGLAGLFYLACLKGVQIPLTKWRLEKKWESSGVVKVLSPTPSNPMAFGSERTTPLELMNRYVTDQMFLLQQSDIHAEALKDSEVQATGWYKREPDKIRLLDSFKDALEVHQAPDATGFVVSFKAPSAADAKTIVERVIELYLRRAENESKSTYMSQLNGAYQTQLADLKARRDQKEQAMRALAGAASGVTGLAEGRNIESEKLRGLLSEAAHAEADLALIRSQWESLRTMDPYQSGAATAEAAIALDSDPQIAQLNRDILLIKQDLTDLLRQVGPNHKNVLAKKADLKAFENRLEELRMVKQQQQMQLQKSQAERAYRNATDLVMSLHEKVADEVAKGKDADTKLIQYQQLLEEQRNFDTQISKLNDVVNQLQLMVNNDAERTRVQWWIRPVETIEPSFPPHPAIVLMLGLILGLMAGTGLAFLLELTDTRLKTGRDLSRHGHIPVLGTVPDLDDEETPIETIELAAHSAPRSMIAEAFRTIRANLMLSCPAERQRSLLVTSSRPEEGKTTVAVNLAISIAQNNRRVLLIDGNFHRPALRGFFSGISTEGLSNVLIGQSKLADVVAKTSLPNLDVLGSGPIPPNPAELLASSYMRQLLSQAVDTYDQVIFDGPPALLVSDVMVLAGALDGILLVCRADSTSRGVLLRAREQFERAGIRIFGGVLNAASVYKRGGYFREQIQQYYDYQPPTEKLAGPSAKALPPGEQGNQRL